MLIECVGIYQARFITSRFAVLFSLCLSLAHTSVPLFFSNAFRMVLCGGAHLTWCGLCILKHAIYHPNREENNNTICTSHSSSGFVCCGCVYGWMAGSLVRVHVRIAEWKRQIYYIMWMDFVCIQGVCGPSMCWILVSFFSASHQFNGNNVWQEQKKNAYISLDVIGSMTDFGCCFADISPKSSTIEHAHHLYLSSG